MNSSINRAVELDFAEQEREQIKIELERAKSVGFAWEVHAAQRRLDEVNETIHRLTEPEL